jgi:predicted nuclease of predicted toxin-antitoxin system
LKILVDHNLDRRLKREFEMHEVSTTQENGWADKLNGELLSLAEASLFDAMITADSNVKNQQNMSGRSISIIVLRAPNNRLNTHLSMIDDVKIILDGIARGEVHEVFHDQFRQK